MNRSLKIYYEQIKHLKDLQEEMCSCFEGIDWDMYKENEENILLKKISHIFLPPDDDHNNGKNEHRCVKLECECDERREKMRKEKNELRELVKKIKNLIVNYGKYECPLKGGGLGKGIFTSFFVVYGCCNKETTDEVCQPVFRVPKDKTLQSALFIDIECRVYQNWDDFLKNNRFPPGLFCYPRNGIYSRNKDEMVEVVIAMSPASTLQNRALQVVDTAGGGVGIGCCFIAVASILSVPVAAPLLAASTVAGSVAALYGAFRASATLVDRGTHGQSVGLDDAEARNCWLAAAGGAVGTVASRATAGLVKMAEAGKTVSKTTTTVVTALNATTLAVGGIGTLNGFFHLQEKYRDGNLNKMDTLFFSANLLLFCNASVNFRTAETIVRNTQDNIIQEFKTSLRSNKHRKHFTKLEKTTMSELGQNEGRAQVIRSVNHIENRDDFMSAVVRNDKQVRYTRSRTRLGDGGTVVINEKFTVNPDQLAQLPKDQKISVLRATQRFSSNRLSEARFNMITEDALSGTIATSVTPRTYQTFNLHNILEHGERFEKHQLLYLSTLLSTMEKKELDKILSLMDMRMHEDFLDMVHNLYKSLCFKGGRDFLNLTYFARHLLEYLLYCTFNATRDRINEVLDGYVPPVPTKELSKTECLFGIVKYLNKNRHLLLNIYFQISDFINLLMTDNNVPGCVRDKKNIDLHDFIPMVNILLQTNEPMRYKIISLAIHFFDVLGYRKMSTLVRITQNLLICLEEAVEEIRTSKGDLPADQSCLNNVLDSMFTDEEVIESIQKNLSENNFELDD